MRTFVYPAKFERGDKPGVFVISFRDVPEAISQGAGEGDALWQASDCLGEAIAGRIADGREIPKASRAARGERMIPLPAQMAAKAAVYLAMREAGMTNVQLARKLGCDEKEVRRMLNPKHPTKLPRIKEVLDVLGKDAKGKYRKLEGNTTVMFLRGCPTSVEVTDINALPLDYQNATVTMPASLLNDVLNALEEGFREEVMGEIGGSISRVADKRAIKAAVEAGVEVLGAELITDKTTLGRK